MLTASQKRSIAESRMWRQRELSEAETNRKYAEGYAMEQQCLAKQYQQQQISEWLNS